MRDSLRKRQKGVRPNWRVDKGSVLLENDPALLRAFREGDRAALSKVYQTYSREVICFLTKGFLVKTDHEVGRLAVPPLDLDAAHQETFIRAFKRSARLAYDGIRPYFAFLRTIARSAAVDLLRASGKVARDSVPLEDALDLEEKLVDARDPEQSVLESELRTVVGHFLETISVEERELARLRFIEGLSQETAASTLGLTRSEARTRERRVKEKFIRHLLETGWLNQTLLPILDHGMKSLASL